MNTAILYGYVTSQFWWRGRPGSSQLFPICALAVALEQLNAWQRPVSSCPQRLAIKYTHSASSVRLPVQRLSGVRDATDVRW